MSLISQLLQSHPLVWKWGVITITAHGLAFAAAAETGYLVLAFLARRRGLSTDGLAEKVLMVFLAGLIGARLGYFIIYPSAFQSIGQVLSIWEGGLVSFFAIITGLGAAWFVFRKQRSEWLGLIAVAGLAAWGVGRLGNYWEGDSVGVMSSTWHLFYGRVPIQLFESVLCFGLAVYWSRHLTKPYVLTWVLMSYLCIRFLVDFWRDEGSFAGLHMSQWAAAGLAVPLIIFVYCREKR